MAGDRFVQQTDEERGIDPGRRRPAPSPPNGPARRRPALERGQMPLLTERGFDLDRDGIKARVAPGGAYSVRSQGINATLRPVPDMVTSIEGFVEGGH